MRYEAAKYIFLSKYIRFYSVPLFVFSLDGVAANLGDWHSQDNTPNPLLRIHISSAKVQTDKDVKVLRFA